MPQTQDIRDIPCEEVVVTPKYALGVPAESSQEKEAFGDLLVAACAADATLAARLPGVSLIRALKRHLWEAVYGRPDVPAAAASPPQPTAETPPPERPADTDSLGRRRKRTNQAMISEAVDRDLSTFGPLIRFVHWGLASSYPGLPEVFVRVFSQRAVLERVSCDLNMDLTAKVMVARTPSYRQLCRQFEVGVERSPNGCRSEPAEIRTANTPPGGPAGARRKRLKTVGLDIALERAGESAHGCGVDDAEVRDMAAFIRRTNPGDATAAALAAEWAKFDGSPTV